MDGLRDREVAFSASDLQGLNLESCVWRAVSSHSYHHPQEVLLAQFSLYVHKSGLNPDSFHFYVGLSNQQAGPDKSLDPLVARNSAGSDAGIEVVHNYYSSTSLSVQSPGVC